jgi:hypothetical protein
MQRKSCFLSEPEWKTSSADLYEQLLNILVHIPSIQEETGMTMSSQATLSSNIDKRQRILGDIYALKQQIFTWYSDLQSLQNYPLFTIISTLHSSWGIQDNSSLRDVFSERINFSNSRVSELLLLYWSSLVRLYSEILHLQQISHVILGALPSMLDLKEESPEVAGDHYATLICQALPAFYEGTAGKFGLQGAFIPLWIASSFYERQFPQKYLWCLEAQRYLRQCMFGDYCHGFHVDGYEGKWPAENSGR